MRIRPKVGQLGQTLVRVGAGFGNLFARPECLQQWPYRSLRSDDGTSLRNWVPMAVSANLPDSRSSNTPKAAKARITLWSDCGWVPVFAAMAAAAFGSSANMSARPSSAAKWTRRDIVNAPMSGIRLGAGTSGHLAASCSCLASIVCLEPGSLHGSAPEGTALALYPGELLWCRASWNKAQIQ